MLRFIAKRLVSMVFVLFAISVLSFLIFFATPGVDPAARIAGRNADQATLRAVRKDFGLDKPVFVRYGIMMKKLFITRDLTSYVNRGEKVIPQVTQAAPVTLSLVLGAAVIWVVFSIAMGLLGPRVGRVYDAHGARVLVIPGALGLVASMTAFVALGQETPTWQILIAHVVLMVSLAALFTPVFTMGLGSLPPHLYSHGSSLLGTTQQVAGAMGTALVVTVMTSRATSLVGDGMSAVSASLDGMRWAFGVAAAMCLVVLGLAAMLPARVDDPSTPDATDELAEEPDPGCAVGAPEPV